MKTAVYLALDPGETTGWATFDDEGELLAMGQFPQRDQTQELTALITSSLKAVIIEDYRNFAWMQQKKWSRNQTSKNIGAIEMLCELRGVPFHLQGSDKLKIGLMYAGIGSLPSNHSISHQYSAVGHGTYWLRVNEILTPTTPED